MHHSVSLCKIICSLVIMLATVSEGRLESILGNTSKGSRFIVLVIDHLGLANRLRSLSDWFTLAALTNRRLLVSWVPSGECNALFLELFEEPRHFDVLPFIIETNPNGVDYVRSAAQMADLSFYYSADKSETIIEPHYPLFSDVGVFLTFHHGVRSFYGVSCVYYLKRKSSFLNSLVPIQPIAERVDNISQMFRNKLMVGVHARFHDSAYDWAVVPPLRPAEMESGPLTNAANFGIGATPDEFINIMNSIYNHFNGSLGPIQFYLASNSQYVKREIMSRVLSTVTLDIPTDSRDSLMAIQTALIELLILARSNLLLHTFGSSFAIEASIYNSIPIVGILEDVLIHHTDPLLPFCGIPLFAAAYGNKYNSEVYLEVGPEFNEAIRVVNSLAISYRVCDSLKSDWGLSRPIWCLTLEN